MSQGQNSHFWFGAKSVEKIKWTLGISGPLLPPYSQKENGNSRKKRKGEKQMRNISDLREF